VGDKQIKVVALHDVIECGKPSKGGAARERGYRSV